MPGIYTPIVPNAFSESSQMTGSGLQLAGSGFSLKSLAKTAGKVADIAIPLGAAAGYDTSQAAAVKKALDGGAFGKGTQKKVLKGAKKGAKIGLKLVEGFGTTSQKKRAATAKRVAQVISGGALEPGLPGAKLRAMMAKTARH